MKGNDDFVSDVIGIIRVEVGLTAQQSGQLEKRLRVEFGGQAFYIAKVDHEARRLAILREFNGRNRVELCEKYKICRSQFYNICKTR